MSSGGHWAWETSAPAWATTSGRASGMSFNWLIKVCAPDTDAESADAEDVPVHAAG